MARYKRGGGWGGSVEFDYEIERYEHKETGDILTEDEKCEAAGDDDSMYEPVTISLTVEGSAYYTPGYTSGLPENCYDSDSDSEIESVIGPGKEDWYNKLSSKELEDITDKLIEQVQDNKNDYESCAADDAYDRWKDDRDMGYDY
jgi:hypothetical protein